MSCFFFSIKKYKVIFIFFFFSSRRRHTRYWRDWSSDVCSSDLLIGTLGTYQLVLAGFEKTRWVFLQPVLASMALVVAILLLCDLEYAEYRRSTEILGILLGPATVALAVPLYLNLRRIRQLFWPTFTTLLIGGVVATG